MSDCVRVWCLRHAESENVTGQVGLLALLADVGLGQLRAGKDLHHGAGGPGIEGLADVAPRHRIQRPADLHLSGPALHRDHSVSTNGDTGSRARAALSTAANTAAGAAPSSGRHARRPATSPQGMEGPVLRPGFELGVQLRSSAACSEIHHPRGDARPGPPLRPWRANAVPPPPHVVARALGNYSCSVGAYWGAVPARPVGAVGRSLDDRATPSDEGLPDGMVHYGRNRAAASHWPDVR
jgi:hypothetical protein